MNNAGEITTEWADGTYAFRLTVAGILELEDKCDAPIAVIAGRVEAGAWKASDIIETLRIGLIGGGATPVDAKKVVDRYAVPLVENWPVARLVLGAALYGFEASPLGNLEAAAGESPNASTPPPSTQPRSSSEQVPEDWLNFPFGNIQP